MKTILGLIVGCLLAVVILVVVLDEDGEGEQMNECQPVGAKAGTGPIKDYEVPAGKFSLPEMDALDKVKSGWRTPDRPNHQGFDIASGLGTEIHAFSDGEVVAAGPADGFGQWIILDHVWDGKKYSTVYGHMFPEGVLVQVGQKVKAGQVIAKEGYNGQVIPQDVRGSHVHFEVWPQGRLTGGHDVNPQPFLEKAVNPGEVQGVFNKAREDSRRRSKQSRQKQEVGAHVAVIGDSITVGAQSLIEKQLPGVDVIAKESQQYSWGLDQLRGLQKKYDVIVMALGTNGAFTQADIDATVNSGKARRYVLMTVGGRNVPAAGEVNALVKKNDTKVGVADWAEVVAEHPEYISHDGVHPTDAGREAFAGVIASSVIKTSTGSHEQKRDVELGPQKAITSEEHLQKNAVLVARAVAHKFPQILTIGGWRNSNDDHGKGLAVDIMIPGWQDGEGEQLGNDVLAYVEANAASFGVEYTIWRQTYRPFEGQPNKMKDQGSYRLNHFDHVHVTTKPSGLPKPDEKYVLKGETTDVFVEEASVECLHSGKPVGEEKLGNSDDIPPEYVKWIEKSAAQCEELTAPIQAALIWAESGFTIGAVSNVGAQGPAQFMPDTWATSGAEVDKNTGEVIGPPGSGDPRSIPDALMASGRYLCDAAQKVKQWKANGSVHGDDTELMLAAYNAGPYAVQSAGGVPLNGETQDYVKKIPAQAKKYEKKVR